MSGGPYNLRSRPRDSDSAPPALSPEQFPPLTPTAMSAPSSSNDDIMDLLRSVAASQAATAAEVTSHSAQLAAMASTDARVERLEALVDSLTTTRTGGEMTTPTTTRTPTVQRVSVRRSLLPTIPEATTSRSPQAPTPTRSFAAPSRTPEEQHAIVEKYELRNVLKLMSSRVLKSLHYDSWLRFYRSLTSVLSSWNAPDEYCKIFSLDTASDFVPDELANRRAYHALASFCAEGEVLAVVQQYESARDGRAAFLKLHDRCNTTTLLSADVLRTHIQSFKIIDTKPPSSQIQRLKELHQQLALAQHHSEMDSDYYIQSLMARLQECSMYKTKMTEFNLDYAAGYDIGERDILSATDVIYVERNRPSTRTSTMSTDRGTVRPGKANALQHRPKPGSTGKKGKGPSSSRTCKYECITCKAFLSKPGQYHYPTACPVLVSKLAEKSPKSAAAKGTEVPPESSTSRTKVHFTRRRPDTSDDSDYWQGVMTEPKANLLVAAINGDDETNFASLDTENSNQALLHACTSICPTIRPDENDISFPDADLVPGTRCPSPVPPSGDGTSTAAQPPDNLFVTDSLDTNVFLSFGAGGRTPDFGLGDDTPQPRSSGRNKIPLEVDFDPTVTSVLSDTEGVCDGGDPTSPPRDAHARSVKAYPVDVTPSTSGTENLTP